MKFPMLRAFRELALAEWYLEESMSKKVAKALLMAFLAVPMMLTVYALYLVHRRRSIMSRPPFKVEWEIPSAEEERLIEEIIRERYGERRCGKVMEGIPREREKEVLRELTWRRMKEKYGLEDLDDQELERARDRLKKLIETGSEEG